MKKLLYLSALFLVVSCSSGNKELYTLTDSFVESLQTTYDSYGILGGTDNMKTTSDGQYQVMPIGRLINVKILKESSSDDYTELEEDLKSHYKDDTRVNNVYICKAGTVMIDCRN